MSSPLTSRSRSRSVGSIIVAALATAAVSCGDPRDGGSAADIETSTHYLLGTNISDGVVANSTFQSETSAVGIGQMAAVAYNTDDTAHGIPNVSKCYLHSQSALSYRSPTGGGWRSVHIPVPSSQGVSSLRGDPSTAFLDEGSTYRVFVASLAISDASWNTLPKRTDGCVNLASLADGSSIDRACVSAVEIPKDGSPAFMGLAFCFAPQSAGRFDGGSLISARNGFIYAVYWNTSQKSAEVYRTDFQEFSLVANPFPGKSINGHPLLVPNGDGAVAVIAPDSTGTFWYTSFNESTLTWLPPAIVASGFSWQRPITLKDGQTLRERGYSATWFSSGPSPPSLLFFYEKPGKGTATKIQGLQCGTIPSLGCTAMTGWTTSVANSAFMLGIAVAHIPQPPSPYPRAAPWISFWNDSMRTDGQVTIRWGLLDFAGSGSMQLFDLGTTERPCSVSRYWGDYDTMAVENDFTAQAGVFRPFTDSTAGACTANGDPQHVSLFTITGL